MEKAIIGKKVGMTQIFDEAGRAIPVTVIQAGPCTVVQKKTAEKDGYEAIQLGFDQINFFGTGDLAFLTLIIYSLWGAGGSMLLWLAAFNGVSPAYYESADIDGANAFVKLFRITLPMVTPMIFYNLVTSIISSMQAFTQVYMLTNGGPTEQTMTMVFTIYNYGIKYREIGQASSMAWFLFVIIFAMTMVVFKTNKWVYYEGGDA